MHHTVMDFVSQHLTSSEVQGKRVLEVGSYNVNGTVRSVIQPMGPAEYLGIDMREGPDVDLVSDITKGIGLPLGPYPDSVAAFDVVVCAEMLEHADDWKRAVFNMKLLVKEGGVLLLTTRSWGFPLHEYPGDYWRFEIVDMVTIFSDMKIEALQSDPLVPGVFVKARAPQGWGVPGAVKDLHDFHVRAMEGGR